MLRAMRDKDWGYVRQHLTWLTVYNWYNLIIIHAPIDIITQMHNYINVDHNYMSNMSLLRTSIINNNVDAIDYLLKKGVTNHLNIPYGTVIVTNHQQITTNRLQINQLVELTRDLTMFRDFYDLCHF